MQTLKIVIAFLALSVNCSCSNEQVYKGIQQNRKNSCEGLQGSRKNECLEQYDKSYERYKKEKNQFDREYVDNIA
jgi:hypothetical protein